MSGALDRMASDPTAFRLATSRSGRKRTMWKPRHRWVENVSSHVFGLEVADE